MREKNRIQAKVADMNQRPGLGHLAASILLGVIGWAGWASAQPLVDRVPSDAIVYFGFSGTDAMPGYTGTHAEALVNASSLPAVFRQVVPAAIRRFAIEQPRDAAKIQQLYDVLSVVAKRPTAVFFSGLTFVEGRREPIPRLGVVCRAGAPAAEQLRGRIQEFLDQAERDGDLDPGVPVRVVTVGEDVALLVGYGPGEMAMSGADAAGARPAGLASSVGFASALKNVQADPAVCLFFDGEKAFELVDSVVQREAGEEDKAQYERVVNALGLRGIRQFIVTGGFDGQDWMTRSFLAAPAPRTGLLANLDTAPLTDELLKAVPANADFFAAGSFDVAKFMTELRSSLGQIDPQIQRQFDQGLGAATMAMGVNLQTGVFEPLGSQWLMYSAPHVAGGGLTGIVAMNRLDDANKARTGLMAVSIFASNTANTFLARNRITMQGRQFKHGELAINYVASPVITPSWSIVGDYAVFGLFPQSIADAHAHLAGGDPSVSDRPEYQKLRQRLGGPARVSGVYFANLPQTAPTTYQGVLIVSRLVGFADVFGVSSPPMVIPPYSVFQKHLSPAGGIKWVDDAGVHGKAVSPFPGAELFQGGGGALPMVMSQSAVFAAIAAPALGRARGNAEDARAMSKARQIAVAIIVHANDGGGALPADLEALVTAGIIEAQDLRRHGEWQYLGDADVKLDKIETPGEVVLLYDAEALSTGRSVVAAFADGHVERLDPVSAVDRIDASRHALERAK